MPREPLQRDLPEIHTLFQERTVADSVRDHPNSRGERLHRHRARDEVDSARNSRLPSAILRARNQQDFDIRGRYRARPERTHDTAMTANRRRPNTNETGAP